MSHVHSVHLTDSAGDVRHMMQLYSDNSHACLVNAVLLKIPVLQSHCSSAMRACRISGCTTAPENLVKHSELQDDMTVCLQKSWRNLQNLLTDNSIVVKKNPCHEKMWTFVIPTYKHRFSVSSLPSREGEKSYAA